MKCEAEVDDIVTGWTRQRTKHEAMAQLSGVGVPAGAVLDTQELVDEPSFRDRGILQTMIHGERTMTMPTWPVRFDGVPTAVKSAPLLGEHTEEVLADWLGLDAAAVAGLRQDGIVWGARGGPGSVQTQAQSPPAAADPAARAQFSRSGGVEQPWTRPTPIYPFSDQNASSNAYLGPPT
jgi:hypothetical protein